MKPRCSGWIAAAALVAGHIIAGSAQTPPARYDAKVVGVVDGDTIDVLAGRTQIKVRIEGIDCPELGQPYGRVARSFASDRVFGRRVEVLPKQTDQYGRLVAQIHAGGEDLGLALLKAGLAWHYTAYSQDPEYASAERAARAARRGLWADKDPVPPWVQRRHPASPKTQVGPAPPQAKGGTIAGPFHGNESSGVFHAPGCPNYNCKRCTAVFATEAEAVAGGFRPAGDCVKRTTSLPPG